MSSKVRRTLTTAAGVLGAMLVACTALAAGVIAMPAAGAAAGAAANRATTPPWEPDPNSVGGLVFYNSSGQVITGGSINTSPIAAYVEGTKTVRSGDTKAALFGYLPVHGEAVGQWSGEQLSGTTSFPIPTGPAFLKASSLPVQTGKSGDETVAQLEADFPNTDTSSDGYADIYVLRLKTSQEGQPGNTTYDSADIAVDNTAGTWTVVYSQSLQATTATALTVSPASGAYHGATVKLTAKVTPSSSAGSVQFLDGTKVLKQVAVTSGAASYSTDSLANGTHKLSAKFVPSDPSETAASTSSVHELKISPRPTTTSLKASAPTITAGQKLTLTARETPAVAGSVTFFDGTKRVAVVKVSGGTASYSSSKLTAGSHSFKASFAPSAGANYASSSSRVVKVLVSK